MELIYIYIDRYRNFQNTELSFGGKFDVKYDKEKNKLFINRNEKCKSIYPSYISNITAVVGRNSVGKTNLMDLIGMKIDDRNINNAEYELTFKRKKQLGYKYPNDVEKEEWYVQYFMLYYLGIKDGKNLFCFEGNNIEQLEKIVDNNIPYNEYYKGKLWFSLVCYYENENLFYLYDMNARLGKYKIEMPFKIWGDYRTESEKLAIISFRNNLNSEIYTHTSLKPVDDYKIAIPRRITRLQSHLWSKKITMLLTLMKQEENRQDTIYADDEYKLIIKYKEDNIFSYLDERPFKKLYSQLDAVDYSKGRIIESFLIYFYIYQLDDQYKKNVTRNLKKMQLMEIKSYKVAVDIYKSIMNIFIQDVDTDAATLIRDEFSDFIDVLNNKYIYLTRNAIEIKLNKNTDIKNIQPVIDVLLDRNYINYTFKDMFGVFTDFFECTLQYLSEGELSNLGMYASILEQLSDKSFAGEKEEYVLLFDEPETSMHPELTRNFINDLIKFLGHFQKDKKFQLIISTHSPFILSDITQDNILLLNKNNAGLCEVQRCNISTFGANIHDILSNSFFMNYTVGEYSKIILDKVIKNLLVEKQTDRELMDKEIINYVISNIGEPILKRKLKREFDKKYSKQLEVDYKHEIIKLLKEMKASKNVVDRDISEIKNEINNIIDESNEE